MPYGLLRAVILALILRPKPAFAGRGRWHSALDSLNIRRNGGYLPSTSAGLLIAAPESYRSSWNGFRGQGHAPRTTPVRGVVPLSGPQASSAQPRRLALLRSARAVRLMIGRRRG